uniref:Laminin G domain-containing protein n=1 Tax=Panagrolaimus davidi TaxID=227884 RepID=A0A914PDU2_9BILA
MKMHIIWSGFVGCIQLIKPNQVSELDLDHPIRSQRKEPGCEFKDAQLLPADGVIGFPKPGYLVTESIKLGTNSSLAFNMRTKNSNAVLLYQKALKKKGKRATDEDEKTFFVFYIFNGRLIVHLGTDHSDRLKRPSLSSNQSYNDGRLHSVFFARNGNSIEVRIDDREILKGHLPDDTIIGTENSKLYFGGLPDWASKEKKDDMGTSEPLIGCLSDFYFNFEKWSIIPEEHHAQLGTCAFDDDITTETDESPADEQKSFERKNSKLSVQRAAPTFVSSSSSDSPESAALLSSFDQNLVGAIPLTETCRAPSMKETEAQIAEGARYGATESSHSKINFASPYPDFKSFKLDFLFRTESPNGTLWVWANYKKYTLYFFLYLEDGFLTLDVKGKDTAVKQLQYKERKLNDGEWHAVDFRKQEHEIQLQVDNLAVETLKDVPHPRVTRKRMFIGGVISRHKKEFNFTRPSFNGCIKDFVVDGISRDLHSKSRDVILCKNTNDVAYIHHGGYASFSALKSFSNTEPNTIEISFKLRSTTNTGLLFALLSQQEYNTTYLFANMTSESIIFTAVHSDKKLFIEHKVPLSSSLCPSEFHRFHLTLTRTNLHIRLNDARGNLQVSIPSTSMDIYRSLPIHIGGVSAKVGDSLHLSSFNGCIKDLYFSGTVVPLSKAKKLHKIIPNGCPLI